MARDWRDERIDELERENAALRAHNREQQAIIEAQRRTIAALERRVEQLEARLRDLEALLARYSGNSSRSEASRIWSRRPATPSPPPSTTVARVLRDEPVVHADETGWYERSKRAWLWGAVTSRMALFLIRARRGARVAKELLGAAFTGTLVSDRWSAYGWVDVARRQLC